MKVKNKRKNATFLCCSQVDLILIWDQYGYWSKGGSCPDWYYKKELREELHYLLSKLKESDLQIDIRIHKLNDGKYEAKWELHDKNNCHIMNYKGAVTECSIKNRAYNYAMDNYYRLKYLYDGDVDAFLVYKRIGTVCLPDWNTNKIDSYGYKNGKENKIPRVSEVLKKNNFNFKEVLNDKT